jgi:hypothetical protein
MPSKQLPIITALEDNVRAFNTQIIISESFRPEGYMLLK